MRAVSRLFLVLSASLVLPFPTSAQELTEAQAIGRFREHSPHVRALRQRVAEQSQLNRSRTLVTNPMVWYTQENAAGVRDDFLQFRQPLPLTGRRGLFQTANQQATAYVEATVTREIQLMEADVRLAFAALFHTQQRERALTESLQEVTETVRVLTAREREGEGSRFDRLRGQHELDELRTTLAGEAIARSRAQAHLAERLGISGSADTLRAIPSAGTEESLPPVGQLVDQALASRADLRAGSSHLASVDAEYEAGRRLRYPQPSVTGGLKRTRVGSVADTGYTFGVELTLPLSNRGQTEAARAEATSTRVRADQDALRLRVEREVQTAHRVATLARQRARDYREGAGASGDAIARIARLAYEEGEQGILELVDAHRVALSTRLRALDLTHEARQAEVELGRAVGNEVIQ